MLFEGALFGGNQFFGNAKGHTILNPKTTGALNLVWLVLLIL